jgi:hypothetical protein
MRYFLDDVGIWRVFPIPLPLDAERIVLVIAHGDLQARKIDFSIKAA